MEEEWELLDLSGPFYASTISTATDNLIYSVGTVVVIWDIHSDRKVNLRCHECPVTSIFFSPDAEYLITAEKSIQPMLCVWRWKSLEQVAVRWLPFKPRRSPPREIMGSFSGKTMVIVENEAEGGFRVSLWEWRAPDLILIQVEELELRESCIYATFLTDNLSLATAERNCIKIWRLDNPITIGKRLHLKTAIKQAAFSTHTALFTVLQENGNVLVLTPAGKCISSLSHPKHHFTALSLFQDYIYLGTSDGALLVYTLRTHRLFRELPSSHTNSIKRIHVSGGNIVFLEYHDSTVQVINVVQGQIINQCSGHSCAVNCARWMERWSFVTSSDEGCLYLWKHMGKGWNMQALDISGGRGNVTAIGVHQRKGIVVCGFNRGVVKFFDMQDKPKYLHSIQFNVIAVSGLKFTPGGHFLAISYANGQVSLTDPNYKQILVNLEEAWSQSINQYADFAEVGEGHAFWLKTLTQHAPDVIQIQVFRAEDHNLIQASYVALDVRGRISGYAFHTSGDYAIAVSDIGGIYIYRCETAETIGVIEISPGARGILLDPSGLYVGTIVPNKEGYHSKLQLFEVGTGRKAAEITRLDDIANEQAMSISKDGRFIIIGGSSGFLSVWKLPNTIVQNIFSMLENLQSNPQFWQQFPIQLMKKELPTPGLRQDRFVASPSRMRYDRSEPTLVEDIRRSQGGFTESVVSFIKNPKKELPRNTELYSTTKSDGPVALTKNYWQQPLARSAMNNSDPNLFGSTRGSTYQSMRQSNLTGSLNRDSRGLQPRGGFKGPAVVKMGRLPDPESIDVDLEEPLYNPARRLYDQYSEKQESIYDEVETLYREMDRFP